MKIRLSEKDPSIKMSFSDKLVVTVVAVVSATTKEWAEYTNKPSKKNYVYVYTDYITDSNGVTHPAVKIGDGNAFVGDLPFISTDFTGSTEQFMEHINNKIIHITQNEREAWNNKVSMEQQGETLVFEIS